MAKPGRIAFAMDNDIYTMEAIGGFEVNVTGKEFGDESIEIDPAWSPDGKRLAFSSNRAGDFDVYVANANGRNVRRVTRAAGDEVYPRWSPDGKKLGLTIERDQASAVAVVNVDGSGLTTVRKGPDGGAIGISDWAPDGSQIVYAADRSSGGGELDTYAMRADGSCAQQLTDAPGDDSGARWSPDGTRIAFGSNRDGGGIYVMAADGSGLTRLTGAPPDVVGFDTFRLAWSSDSQQIVWTGKHEGGRGTEIYLVRADGTGLTAVHAELAAATVVDWQPVPS